jgi:uncharacterized Zn finger protein
LAAELILNAEAAPKRKHEYSGDKMRRIEFTVRGTKGDLYTCTFERDGNNLNAFCTCPDGRAGSYCKHRFALIDGNRSIVVSDNAHEVDEISEMITGTDVEAAGIALAEAMDAVERAEELLIQAKRDFATAMRK